MQAVSTILFKVLSRNGEPVVSPAAPHVGSCSCDALCARSTVRPTNKALMQASRQGALLCATQSLSSFVMQTCDEAPPCLAQGNAGSQIAWRLPAQQRPHQRRRQSGGQMEEAQDEVAFCWEQPAAPSSGQGLPRVHKRRRSKPQAGAAQLDGASGNHPGPVVDLNGEAGGEGRHRACGRRPAAAAAVASSGRRRLARELPAESGALVDSETLDLTADSPPLTACWVRQSCSLSVPLPYPTSIRGCQSCLPCHANLPEPSCFTTHALMK